MDETQARAEVHRTIIERYPMYHEDPAFEAWMFDRTGSDAGKIAEVLDALAAYGYLDGEGMVTGNYAAMPDPSVMTEEMRGRLDAIDGRTRELLRIASVEGPTFSAEVLAHIDGASVADVDASIARAIDSGVVQPDGGEAMFISSSARYRFHPQIVRDMLYHELPGDRRAELHRRAIEFLSSELEQTTEPGAREMIGQLIEEHNRHASRPAGSAE